MWIIYTYIHIHKYVHKYLYVVPGEKNIYFNIFLPKTSSVKEDFQ